MWVLYNLAHKNSSIKSSDGEAWIRILGFFITRDLGVEHAKKIVDLDPGLEIRIAPQGEFRLMLRDRYKDQGKTIDMETRSRETKKHNYLTTTHALKRKEAFEEARINAEQRNMGKVVFSPEEKIASYLDLKPQSFAPKGIAKISKDLELRMQTFACIAVIKDYEHEKILEDELHKWEKNAFAENAILRNNAIRDRMGENSCFPNTRTLMESWVLQNPPKQGFNIHGCPGELWSSNKEDPSQDTEVQSWVRNFNDQKEVELWKYLGMNCPQYKPDLGSLPDMSGAEPAVAFLHFANTEEKMNEWIEQDSKFQNFDIACVNMYEWIQVKQLWNEGVKRSHRNKMVEKLYQKKDFQHKEAAKLEGVKEILIET